MGRDSSLYGPGSHHRRIVWVLMLASALFAVLIWSYVGRGDTITVEAPASTVVSERQQAAQNLVSNPYNPPTTQQRAQAIAKIKKAPALTADQKAEVISTLKAIK